MIIDQGLQQGGVQVAECGVDGWRESEQGRMGGRHKPHHSAPPTATASAPFANCPRPHSASLRLAPRFRGEGEGGAGGWGARSEAKHGRFGIDGRYRGQAPAAPRPPPVACLATPQLEAGILPHRRKGRRLRGRAAAGARARAPREGAASQRARPPVLPTPCWPTLPRSTHPPWRADA